MAVPVNQKLEITALGLLEETTVLEVLVLGVRQIPGGQKSEPGVLCNGESREGPYDQKSANCPEGHLRAPTITGVSRRQFKWHDA